MRAIAANEGRYPISAQCRLLGVARSTYYSMRSRADRPDAPDPAAPAVVAAHAASKGRYGSRKIKASLERSGVTVSRRRVCRVSVNLFFTSFAKQARRSRKGGFTGCANVFSPIPVTA